MYALLLSSLILNAAPTPQTGAADEKQLPPVSTLIANQFATIAPSDMNPLDYKDKIENTIYQTGDRLIIIQSIPIKYIKQATEPNTQPTINTFPSF